MATSVIQYLLVKPDWDENYSLKRTWKTSFQSSINNNEKRSALFTWPRRSLRFTLEETTHSKLAYLNRILHKNLPYVWGVPIWHDASALTSAAASGQKIIELDTTYRNFEVGADVVINADKDSYEIGVIASKTDSQITLVSNLASNWAKNIYVYPILKGRISKTQNISLGTTTNPKIEISVSETYDEITRYSPSISSFPTYNGYPIFNTPPNWVSPVEESHLFKYELLKYIGNNVLWTQWDNGEYKFKSIYDKDNKSDIQDIIDFFDYHKGRWGAFWRPSWIDDIKLTATASVGDFILTAEDIDWENYWDDSVTGELTGSHIILIWPDGSYQVTSIKDFTGTTLKINKGLTKAITSSDLNLFLVSFLYLVRFNQDEIEAKYDNDSSAVFELNFQSLSKEFPAKITTTTTTTSTTSSTTSSTSSTTSTFSTTSSTSSTFSTTSTTSSTSSTFSTTSTSSTTTTTASFTTVTTTTVWLGTWAYRRKITIDNTNIDSNLSHFPIPIVLGTAVGQSSQDVSDIFDELGANSKKIAITLDDALTEIYGEIEMWDSGAEYAVIHASSSGLTVNSGTTTDLYFYFDSTESDNTTYIGDTTDAAAQNVWDSNFALVFHMAQDPSGGSDAIKDSTSNANHGTSSGSMTSGDLVDGSLGKAIDFDGSDDVILTASSSALDFTSTITLEASARTDVTSTGSVMGLVGRHYPTSEDTYSMYINSDNEMQFATLGGNIQGQVITFDTVTFNVFAGTYNSTGLTGKLFLNGAEETLSNDNYDTMAGLSRSLAVGANVAADLWTGAIEEIRVSDVVRSDAWLKATFYAMKDNLITFGTTEVYA